MASFSARDELDRDLPPRRVVVVIYPGVTLLDATGPAQVFSSANFEFGETVDFQRYSVELASPGGGLVASGCGIELNTASLKDVAAEAIDTLIVAGGSSVFDYLKAPGFADWITAQSRQARRVASTCIGAFLTGEAGLLDGETVTTHWRYVDDLQRRYPETRVECDPLFTHNNGLWSSAGVSAGIDMALAMVEEDHGHEVAMQVAQSLVVYFKRSGGQSQFSRALLTQKRDEAGAFSQLHAWIASNLQADLGVEALAERAGMSLRSFARHYRESTGMTPAKAVDLMRVDMAKRLLERGDLPLPLIAAQSGLTDVQRLRRAFLRHAGVSPSEYQSKFSKLRAG